MASHTSAAVLNAKKKKQGKRKPIGGVPPALKKSQPAANYSESESDFGSDDEEDPSDYKKGT